MDFKKFTTDAKFAIVKLETYGLSCLIPSITREETFVPTDTEVRIWREATNWNELGALAELADPHNAHWSFELNFIRPDNQVMMMGDILVGFIMLPKRDAVGMMLPRYQTPSVSDSKINADLFAGPTRISTFQFEPFKFVPMIHNTYFLSISSYYYPPVIRFDVDQSINYDVYCLTAVLQTAERRYCAQVVNELHLSIPITNDYVMTYASGMCGIQTWKIAGIDPNTNTSDYDLTTDLPILQG